MNVPDVLAFVAEGLTRRGSLVEREGETLLALSAAATAADLSIREESRLAADVTDSETVPCGFGSPVLERLIGDARAQTPWVAGRLDVDPPRATQAVSLAERFFVRNGLCEVADASIVEAQYLVAAVSVFAEADDRHETLIHVVAEASDGAEPDVDPVAWMSMADGRSVDRDGQGSRRAVEGGAAWVAVRAKTHAKVAVTDIADGVSRRHLRDHARISEYYAALIAEARAPRRKTEGAAVEPKVSHLVAERDKRIRDLDVRFQLKVSLRMAALYVLSVPAVRVNLHVRRRKETRTAVVRFPAGARALDRPACDGCLGTAPRPALCDGKLHFLCEACAPSSQGRLQCSACAGQSSG